MNRIRELCDLYEKNQEKVGVIERGRYGEKLVLLPVFHSTVAAQITVAIDESGEFLYAEPVAEEDKNDDDSGYREIGCQNRRNGASSTV